MQKQEQVERHYSFEEICPEWSQLLADNGGYMKNKNQTYKEKDGQTIRNIQNWNCCIVGEAHSL